MENKINHGELIDEYAKSKVLTEVVSYLGSTATFEEIARRMTKLIGEYLKVTNVALMVIENEQFEVFYEWVRDDSIEFFEKAKDDI